MDLRACFQGSSGCTITKRQLESAPSAEQLVAVSVFPAWLQDEGFVRVMDLNVPYWNTGFMRNFFVA